MATKPKEAAPKIGRPVTGRNGSRRNLYLDDETMELATKVGNGSASEGLRIMAKAYKGKKQ